MKHLSLKLLVAAGLLTSILQAGVTSPSAFETLPASSPEEKRWEGVFEIYGWGAGASGHATLGGVRTDIDFGLDQILDNLDMTVMVAGGFRYDRFTFMADYLYLKMGGSSFSNSLLFPNRKLSMELNLLNLIGTYRIWESDQAFIELGGGARYMGLDVDVSLFGGLAPARFPSLSADSWNGVAAIRGGYDFNERWGVRGYFDIGSGDADLTWMANLDFTYQMSPHSAFVLGYRYVRFDVEKGANRVELDLSGPYMGVAFTF